MAFAGVTASGAAYVRSNAPVRPASPWSLVERMGALRIDRSLPPAVRKEATFSLRGPHAVIKVREATGPVLLKCPLRADVPAQFLRFAPAGSAQPCEAPAGGEVGDRPGAGQVAAGGGRARGVPPLRDRRVRAAVRSAGGGRGRRRARVRGERARGPPLPGPVRHPHRAATARRALPPRAPAFT